METSNLTFGIIKPDAVRAGHIGNIIQRITDSGFKLRALKTLHMTLKEAEGFYAVHRERPFFAGLTEFMSSAPCVVMVLEKEGAVRVHWTFLTNGKRREMISFNRMYSKEHLSELLRKAGLRVVRVFGDLQGAAYKPIRSTRLVILARKPA